MTQPAVRQRADVAAVRVGRSAGTVSPPRRPRGRPQGHRRRGRRPVPIPAGRVPLSWLSNRRVAHARIKGRFADIGDPDTLRWLAQRLPEVLVRCGVRDLDVSAATGAQRELTQAIARELCLHGDTHAIDYPSRYGETIRCIAVFETDGDLPDIEPVGTAYGPSIEADDHALEHAMRLHRLSWEL